MKAVLFATAPEPHVDREARALTARLGAESVRVVAEPAGLFMLLRLWVWLGFAPAEVYCLSNGHSHRFLKLLAYGVRGRVVFIGPAGQAPLKFWTFLLLRFRLWTARENGALLVGSASPATLDRLAADLSARRSDSCVDVLRDPSLGDFLSSARHWRRYRYLAIPWTGEGRNLLKLAAWFLPCGRREIYNEVGDSFSVRRVGVLLAHIGRRFSERCARVWNGLRYAAWRTGDAFAAAWNGLRYALWWIGDRLLALWYALFALPEGITVIGSASGYYMKDIVADLRRKHPGQPVYGMLPARLVGPAARLFDHVIPFRAGAILRHALGRCRTGYLAIPCTNEGYNRFKLLGALLPLGRRLIYNENGDGYPVRRWSTLVEHGFWRLRHRLFYQAFTERRGRALPVLAMHLLLYPMRLLAGAFVMAGIRLRAHRYPIAVAAPLPVSTTRDGLAKVVAATTTSQVLDPAER